MFSHPGELQPSNIKSSQGKWDVTALREQIWHLFHEMELVNIALKAVFGGVQPLG